MDGVFIKRPTPAWCFIFVFFIAWTIRLSVYDVLDIIFPGPYLKRTVSDGFRALIWLLLPFIWLKFVEHRSLSTAIYPCSTRSRGYAWLSGSVYCCFIVIGYRLTFGHWTGIPLHEDWTTYTAIVPNIVLVGIAEEFVFRGVFLSGLLRNGWAPWRANLITATLFALSHWPGWFAGPSSMGPFAYITASIRLMVFGLVMGGLTTLEGGILIAIVVHSFNDLWVGLFFH